jgi:hypothetical protein
MLLHRLRLLAVEVVLRPRPRLKPSLVVMEVVPRPKLKLRLNHITEEVAAGGATTAAAGMAAAIGTVDLAANCLPSLHLSH